MILFRRINELLPTKLKINVEYTPSLSKLYSTFVFVY